MIIGICGKSGSGKSTLAKEIIKNKKNVIHLDIDKIGHNILTLKEVKNNLFKAFGSEIIKNQEIDRSKLSNLVFNSKENMDVLSDITWKHMEKEIDNIINDSQNKIIILDWILLPNTKYFDVCDLKVLIDVPKEIRKERAIKRDKITSDKFDKRDENSIEYNFENFDLLFQNSNCKSTKRWVKSL